MRVLIVQSNDNLGLMWQRHLERMDATVDRALTGDAAVALVTAQAYDVIVLDVILTEGSAMSVADIANFRQPNANVVFVTDSSFFSDGSIFNHSANACTILASNTPPSDLAAIVDHYGTHRHH